MDTSTARGLLGLTQQEVAKLGAFGVARESLKLLGGLHPTIAWIQFAFFMPYTLYLIVTQNAQRSIFNRVFPRELSSPTSLSIAISNDFANLDQQKWLSILHLLFLDVLNMYVSLAILGAVFFAVGSIYNGRNVTFPEVVHSLPRLWSRLFVTALVTILLDLSVELLFAVSIVVFKFTVPYELLRILLGIFAIILMIPTFTIFLMSQVAYGVTCFEGHCGVTAFRKGNHILLKKWASAVRLAILLTTALSIAAALIQFPVELTQEFHWRWLVLAILYVIVNSYVAEVIYISWAVFYFSCVAKYEQDAAIHQCDDHLEFEVRYQPILRH